MHLCVGDGACRRTVSPAATVGEGLAPPETPLIHLFISEADQSNRRGDHWSPETFMLNPAYREAYVLLRRAGLSPAAV